MANKILLCILLAALLGAGIYIFILRREVDITNQALSKIPKKVEIPVEAEIIARKVDTEGLEHVIIEEVNKITVPQLEQGESLVIDSLKKKLGIQSNQLENYTAINSQLKAMNLKAEQVIDSMGRETFSYRDKYVDLFYRPSLGLDTTDHGQFDFRYNAELNITQYWKKKWFLAARRSYIDIWSNDPRTTINGVKRLTVSQERPEFGLRFQAASAYDFDGKQFAIGPALRIDLGGWSIQGQYLLNPDDGKWRRTINLTKDIKVF